jgi:predicted dithiol-disulfide oxidoreductase (DUF899 family)
MADRKPVTREEWEAARKRLIEREEEVDRLRSQLAEERQKLPWLPVEKAYEFETDEGTKTLADLFDGRSQLLVYHMMFAPDWTAGCPACSNVVDHFDGALPLLNARDVTVVVIAHAPLETLQAYKRRMGWTSPYVSAFESDFNYDFGVSFTDERRKEFADDVLAQFADNDEIAEIAASVGTDVEGYLTYEAPGLSAFALEDGVVYRTYGSYAPEQHARFLVLWEQMLEHTAKGGDPAVPLRRHDEYGSPVRH